MSLGRLACVVSASRMSDPCTVPAARGMVVGAGCGMVGARCGMVGAGCGMVGAMVGAGCGIGAGRSMVGAGCGMVGAGCGMVGAGHGMAGCGMVGAACGMVGGGRPKGFMGIQNCCFNVAAGAGLGAGAGAGGGPAPVPVVLVLVAPVREGAAALAECVDAQLVAADLAATASWGGLGGFVAAVWMVPLLGLSAVLVAWAVLVAVLPEASWAVSLA